MTKYLFTALSILLFFATVSAQAEQDITGTWKGEFKGIFLKRSGSQGPVYRFDQLRDTQMKPNMITNPLTVVIDFHEGDLVSGHWVVDDEKGTQGDGFVCGMLKAGNWRCLDKSRGVTEVNMLSDTEMRLCYFGGEENYGGGCAILKKQ